MEPDGSVDADESCSRGRAVPSDEGRYTGGNAVPHAAPIPAPSGLPPDPPSGGVRLSRSRSFTFVSGPVFARRTGRCVA